MYIRADIMECSASAIDIFSINCCSDASPFSPKLTSIPENNNKNVLLQIMIFMRMLIFSSKT